MWPCVFWMLCSLSLLFYRRLDVVLWLLINKLLLLNWHLALSIVIILFWLLLNILISWYLLLLIIIFFFFKRIIILNLMGMLFS